MRVPAELLEGLDLAAVVKAELSTRNRFLPPDPSAAALRGHAAQLAQSLGTAILREFVPDMQETVLARKLSGGSRPLPFMSLRDRIVYRAMATLIAPDVGGPRGDHGAFKTAVLELEDCAYVLKTDVTAFYQYIDHERLIDEVVAQTGSDLAVVTAMQLLQASTGRMFGLPQMSHASDALSQIYIDPVRRDLVRAGFTVFTYADDFRVACDDYSAALEATEVAERSAFNLGLVLSESKTATPARATYVESLGDTQRAERQLFAIMDFSDDESYETGELEALAQEAVVEPPDVVIGAPASVISVEDFFLLDFDDEYVDIEADDWATLRDLDVDEDDEADTSHPGTDDGAERAMPTDRQVAAAELLLSLWESNNTRDEDPGPYPTRADGATDDDATINRSVRTDVDADDRDDVQEPPKLDWSRATWSTLLRKALVILTRTDNIAALPHATSLLVYEPHLTPQVCGYMSELAKTEPSAVSDALDTICAARIVSVWQALWIAHCAGTIPTSESSDDSTHVQWLQTQLTTTNSCVAVEAAMSLARRSLLDPDDAARVYGQAPAVHRPTAFMAMAGSSMRHGREVVTSDQAERWLADWVAAQPWGTPEGTQTTGGIA